MSGPVVSRSRRALVVVVASMALAVIAAAAHAAPAYRTFGQPNVESTTLATRCADPNARFGYTNDGFQMFGPPASPSTRAGASS